MTTIIQADSKGTFTDTVIVDAQWLSGAHTLHAEDAHTHKIASFTILVTGHSSFITASSSLALYQCAEPWLWRSGYQ